MVSVRPSPAGCSPLDLLTSTGPQPLDDDVHDSPDSCDVPAGGGLSCPRDTRYSTVPCDGTEALIAPVVDRDALLHKSFSVYDDDPPLPTSVAVVLTVAVAPVSLSRATARSPLASCLL